MEHTTRIFNRFIKTLHNTEEVNFKTFDLIELLKPTKEDIQSIKSEYADGDVIINKSYREFHKQIVKKFIFDPFRESLLTLLRKAHRDEFLYNIEDDPNRIKVVDVMYGFYIWNHFFIHLNSNNEFYDWYKDQDLEEEFRIDEERTETQLKKFLDYLEIDYSEWLADDYNDLWHLEEDEGTQMLFIELVFECWKQVKEEEKSDLLGFIWEGRSMSDTYDLDTQESLEELGIGIIKQVQRRGFSIKPESGPQNE